MDGQHFDQDDDVALDFKSILGAIWNAKRWVFPVVLLAAVGTFLVLSIIPAVYRADSKVLIESAQSVFEDPGRPETERARLDQNGVGSQVQLLTSRDLARRVAKKLDLASKAEFDAVGTGNRSTLNDVFALLGISGDRGQLSPEERVLEAYYKALSVFPVKDSRVISVEFKSRDARLAADAANAIVEEYLTLQRGVKRSTTSNRAAMLAPEIQRLQAQVKKAEEEVEKFRSGADLLLGANNVPLAQQQLAELNTQLSAARSARSQAAAEIKIVRDLLKSGKPIDTASNVLNSNLIQRLRERQVAQKARIAELSTTLMNNHPQIRSLRSQLADYDKQIRSEIRKILNGLENDRKVAAAQVESLTANLNELKTESSKANKQLVRLRELERDAEVKGAQLASLLSKYGEADATRNAAILPADARIISRAIAPTKPYWPQKLPITLAVTMAVFLICCAIVLMREFTSGRALRRTGMPLPPAAVGRHDPIEPLADLVSESDVAEPPLAPEIEPLRAAHATVADDPVEPVEPVAESIMPDPARVAPTEFSPPPQARPVEPPSARPFVRRPAWETESDEPDDMFWTSIKSEGRAIRVIVVSSAVSNDLAHSVASDISRSAAGDGRAVLVDLFGRATRTPRQSRQITGMADLVSGRAGFGEAISQAPNSRAHLIEPGTHTLAMAGEGAVRFDTVMLALSHTYDFVVVDVGVLGADEATAMMLNMAEIVILAAPATGVDDATYLTFDTLSDGGVAGIQILTAKKSKKDGQQAA